MEAVSHLLNISLDANARCSAHRSEMCKIVMTQGSDQEILDKLRDSILIFYSQAHTDDTTVSDIKKVLATPKEDLKESRREFVDGIKIFSDRIEVIRAHDRQLADIADVLRNKEMSVKEKLDEIRLLLL